MPKPGHTPAWDKGHGGIIYQPIIAIDQNLVPLKHPLAFILFIELSRLKQQTLKPRIPAR